jgi:hypothetical protein
MVVYPSYLQPLVNMSATATELCMYVICAVLRALKIDDG